MQYALVAGGSKGIGFAIAKALAKRRYHLILIARHMNTLEEARQTLETNYPVKVLVLPIDLSQPGSPGEIREFCIRHQLPVSILCNVAGLGGAKDYLSLALQQIRQMIHLNLESQVSLIQQLLPVLEKNHPAHILNVASMAGFAPIPVKNMYSSTKSAVIFFSRALRSQLKKSNISVSCLCPGPVFTKPEIKKDTIEKMGWFGKQMAVSPERVGEIAIHQMLRKKFMIIPGSFTKVVSFFVRMLPDKVLTMIYERMIEKSS
jgi:uncharacterized protein